jgi:signal transduction histidine kinase/CheY-like chemotaxis protein
MSALFAETINYQKKSISVQPQYIKRFYLFVYLAALFVMAIFVVFIFWTAHSEDILMKEQLLNETRLAGSVVNWRILQSFTGTEADIVSSDYLKLKEQLSLLRSARPHCRFTYLMGRKADGTIFIFLDSEPSKSPDYSPPGQVYAEVPDAYKRVFITGHETITGPVTDRWGKWISGLIPIIDPQTKKCVAVFGMDIDARDWNMQIVKNCILPIIVTLMLSLMLLAFIIILLLQRSKLELEAFQSHLLTNLPFGVVIIDPVTRIIEIVNTHVTTMFGAPLNNLIGHRCHSLLCPATEGACPVCDLDNTVDNSEREMMRADGSRIPIFKTVKHIKLHGQEKLLECFFDITDRKRAEAERERLESQLIQAQKMEAVGRLAGGVAHDFNNMLAVILGNVELALANINPSDSLHGDLEEIQKAGKRSAELTSQLLAFARKQTVMPKVLDLNETIEGIIKMLRRLISEDISLSWNPGNNLRRIKIDPSQIDQILANLCVNARDAISDVGAIAIETANVLFDEAYCAIHTDFNPGDYVMLAVSDNGCGIDKETQSKLFEPFFTTKEMGKGTGLGLATVYGIVKQNNGFINIYSEPGKGTTFRIYLPCHGEYIEKVSEERLTEAIKSGSETILLVEDELAIMKFGKTILERLGYKVLAANSPGEAILLAEEYSGQINLLLTDVVMPEMNGSDLAKHLQSLYPQLKLLFMSGYSANIIAEHCALDKSVHFIPKPFSMKDLAFKIREALE